MGRESDVDRGAAHRAACCLLLVSMLVGLLASYAFACRPSADRPVTAASAAIPADYTVPGGAALGTHPTATRTARDSAAVAPVSKDAGCRCAPLRTHTGLAYLTRAERFPAIGLIAPPWAGVDAQGLPARGPRAPWPRGPLPPAAPTPLRV